MSKWISSLCSVWTAVKNELRIKGAGWGSSAMTAARTPVVKMFMVLWLRGSGG